MRVHFELADPDGSVIATGSDAAQTIDLGSWDNHSSVVRLLHARGVPTRIGQRLTMWVEVDQPMPIFSDETIDRAAEAFHQAVGSSPNAENALVTVTEVLPYRVEIASGPAGLGTPAAQPTEAGLPRPRSRDRQALY